MPDKPTKTRRSKAQAQKTAPTSLEMMIVSAAPPDLAKGEGDRVVYVEAFELP